MEQNKLEAILDKIIEGLKSYNGEDCDNEIYYVELLKELNLDSESELYSEEYGMNEEAFAKEAIKYEGLHDKMREIISSFIRLKKDWLPLFIESDGNMFAGHYIAYELANQNKDDLPLYADYIELLPFYGYAEEPRCEQVPALTEKWGEDATWQINENFRNEFNADDMFDEEEYDEE